VCYEEEDIYALTNPPLLSLSLSLIPLSLSLSASKKHTSFAADTRAGHERVAIMRRMKSGWNSNSLLSTVVASIFKGKLFSVQPFLLQISMLCVRSFIVVCSCVAAAPACCVSCTARCALSAFVKIVPSVCSTPPPSTSLCSVLYALYQIK
jgi:hypothetical protein